MHSPRSIILLLFCILPLALCLPSEKRWFWDVNKRHAFITIQNDTPDVLTSVSVAHKYSNVYKEDDSWDNIKPNSRSVKPMKVEYNTGDLTTGRDWWLVTYHRQRADSTRKNQVKLWYSDPVNFRDLIDLLEKVAPSMIKAAINAAKGSNPALLPAAKAAQIAAKQLCKVLFNSESTAGYKQHILTDADFKRVTFIVINADDTITFKSVSGTSNTVTSNKWVPAEHA